LSPFGDLKLAVTGNTSFSYILKILTYCRRFVILRIRVSVYLFNGNSILDVAQCQVARSKVLGKACQVTQGFRIL